MADVERRTEDWQMLPWKEIQRNVYRLQKCIYQAARREHTASGADENSPRTEERSEVKVSRSVLKWRRGRRLPRRP
jgi:hypothetical protein